MRFFCVVFSIICGLFSSLFAQSKITESELISRIRECADYAYEILIDEEGKSRCDYNLFESNWIPYETPWHTGQLINALLEAYRVTGEKAYLDKATFSGNWWIGLEIKNHPILNGMIKGIHGSHMDDNLIVFATISDGTPGIYNLSKVTKNPVYAETATRAAKWMLENMVVS